MGANTLLLESNTLRRTALQFPKVTVFLCQETVKPRERSPSRFRVSGAGIWIRVRLKTGALDGNRTHYLEF